MDCETKAPLVFVIWHDQETSDPSWLPMDALTPETVSWWQHEAESRFPGVDFAVDSPKVRYTGGPVTVVFDDVSLSSS